MLQLYFIHNEKVSRCLDYRALSAVFRCFCIPRLCNDVSMTRVLISIAWTSLVFLFSSVPIQKIVISSMTVIYAQDGVLPHLFLSTQPGQLSNQCYLNIFVDAQYIRHIYRTRFLIIM